MSATLADLLTLSDYASKIDEAVRAGTVERALIYFIQEGDDGPIKVGVSSNPRVRLGRLQIGNPRKLRVRSIYNGLSFEEKQIHKEYAYAHIAGEWFNPVPDLIALADGCDDSLIRREVMRETTDEEEAWWDAEQARLDALET